MKRFTIESSRDVQKNPRKNYYYFRLFVAGNEANSTIALNSLDNICSKNLKNRCKIEIVNIFEDYQSALDEDILITPALVIRNNNGRVVVFGNLKEVKKVLDAIDSLDDNDRTPRQ